MDQKDDRFSVEKVMKLEDIQDFNEEKNKTGIVYISRIPPMMGPQEIRSHLSPFGEITRIYLTPADKSVPGKKGKAQNNKKRGLFVDGWVEFRRKKSAKDAALALNGSTVAGKRTSHFYGELWSIKYLKDFKWSNLTEQIAYEKAVRDQKLRTEIDQAKREASFYLKQVEKAETMSKIEAKKASKRKEGVEGDKEAVVDQDEILESVRKRFRQRKPIRAKNS